MPKGGGLCAVKEEKLGGVWGSVGEERWAGGRRGLCRPYPEKLHSCPLCGYHSANKTDFTKHYRTHTGEKPFVCKSCNYKCANRSNLSRHSRRHERESEREEGWAARRAFACSACSYRSKSKNNVARHVRTHSREGGGRRGRSGEEEGEPYARVSEDDLKDRPFSCTVCGYRSVYRYTLRRHVEKHRGERLLGGGDVKEEPLSSGEGGRRRPAGSFSCDVCRYTCSRRETLVRHVGEGARCGDCGYPARCKGESAEHAKEHARETRFVCELCGYTAALPGSFARHAERHARRRERFLARRGKPFACEECPFRSRYKGSLEAHRSAHTGEKRFVCNVCGLSYTYRQGLNVHLKTHTGEGFHECPLCEYRTPRKYDFEQHLRRHTGEKPYACHLCGYRSTFKTNLARHRRTHSSRSPTLPLPIPPPEEESGDRRRVLDPCDSCGFVTRYRSVMTSHAASHVPDRRFRCRLCRFTSSSGALVKSHVRVHDLRPSEPGRNPADVPLLCEACGYRSFFRGNMLKHVRKHEREREEAETAAEAEPVCATEIELSFVCGECGYSTPDREDSEKHVRRHEEDSGEEEAGEWKEDLRGGGGGGGGGPPLRKIFACHVCGFESVYKASLRVHEKMHTDERPYGCALCEFRTAHKSALKVHKRRHSREGLHACDSCPYTTVVLHDLKKHARIHSGEKPFVCRLCDYKSSFKSNLVRHYKKHERPDYRLLSDDPHLSHDC